MPGLVPGIHALLARQDEACDGSAQASLAPRVTEQIRAFLNQLPHPRRGERQHVRLDAERIGDGVGDDAADRDDAALAGALGAERVVRRRVVLQRVGADHGEVGRGGEKIIGERAGEELALGVVGEVFQQRAAEPLHDGADGLAVQGQRIDDAADILDGHVVDQRDMAGAGIDRDMGGVGAVGIGALAAANRCPPPRCCRSASAASETLARFGPTALSPSMMTADGSHCRRFAAAARMASLRKPAACTMAEPPITMERDEYEP